MKENLYHFSLHLKFLDDVDVDKIEKQIGIIAYKKTPLKESVGKNKSAKIWYKTQDKNNTLSDKVLENYILKMQEKFEIIKDICLKNNGKATLTMYYDQIQEKPYLKLTANQLKILADNNIDFELDLGQ